MTNVASEDPGLYVYLEKGRFAAQIHVSGNPFSTILVDQAMEETVHIKDTQPPERLKGFSVNLKGFGLNLLHSRNMI